MGTTICRAALALVAALSLAQASAADMNMRVFRINDHLLSFYVGRPAQNKPLPELPE